MKLSASILGAVLGAALLYLCMPSIVLAIDYVPLPNAPASSGGASIPVGQLLADWQPFVFYSFTAIIGIAFRHLPANVTAILQNMRVELALKNALAYGYNAVKDAEAGKPLNVDLGSKVANQALQYFVDNVPAAILKAAGGPENAAKKLWGRMTLDPSADASALDIVTTAVDATKKKD